MLNDLHRWVEPRVWSVRVGDVRAYLQRKGWTACAAPRPQQLAFEEPAGNPDGPARLYVPESEQFSDYPQRILEVVTTLAEIEGRYAALVLDDILQSRASAEPNGAGQAGRGRVLPVSPESEGE
jgi:hypothetical protein